MICIAGKNEIAVSALLAAVRTWGVRSVCACPNRSDQGGASWQPSLRRFASELGVQIVTLDELEAMNDLTLFSLEFDRIIRTQMFKSSRLYNVHFSLLPAYKGVYPAAWPILNGESRSGVTLHCMDHGIDTGAIIEQRSFPIEAGWTARDLYLKCMVIGVELILQAMPRIVDGHAEGVAQGSENSSYYGPKSINYANLSINFQATAAQVQRQIRAYSFREFQIPLVEGFPVRGAEILTTRSIVPPGQLVAETEEMRRYATVDFDIALSRDRSWDYFSLVHQRDAVGIRNYLHKACDINWYNAKGWTPLMVAAFGGDTACCDALLDRGARPDLPNPNGTTALMYAKDHALSTGDTSVVELLLRRGANPQSHDRFGKAAMDYLRQMPRGQVRDEVIRLLAQSTDRN